jgi:trans-aconitate methyltransferase
MRPADARALLAKGEVGALGASTWADLGCGDGTFTIALAGLLAPGSTIHAMDREASALRKIPSTHQGTRITTHRGDFTSSDWPFENLDGILLANSLHYVGDQLAFIRSCAPHLKRRHQFLIVEYDSTTANPWVPYPVSQKRLADLFKGAGYPAIELLGSRPSVFRRSPLYAASITSSG